MSRTRNEVARVLLEKASRQEVVDLLFPLADDVSRLRGTSPSPHIATRFVKGSLSHAVLVVSNSNTAPDVLAAYEKDSRVSVREALLLNPETPVGTLQRLAPWAFKRENDDVLAAVIRRIPSADAVALAEEHASDLRRRRYYSSPRFAVALARKAEESIVLTTALLKLNISPVTNALLRRVASGKNPHITLAQACAVEGTEPVVISTALNAVWRRGGTLTAELATLATRHDVHAYCDTDVEAFTMVEPGSLEILADGPRDLYLTSVALGLPESAILTRLERMLAGDETVSRTVPSELAATISTGLQHRKFTTATVHALIGHLIEASVIDRAVTSTASVSFLESLTQEVPSALMLRWLRSQDFRLLRAWLAGTGPAAPRGGQLLALMKVPGAALTSVERRRDRGLLSNVSVSLEREQVLQRIAQVAGVLPPGRASLPDFEQVLDAWAGPRLATSEGAAVATPVLERAFGGQEQAWDTFLTLATDWSGSLSDLVAATLTLSGADDKRDMLPARAEQSPHAMQELLLLA